MRVRKQAAFTMWASVPIISSFFLCEQFCGISGRHSISAASAFVVVLPAPSLLAAGRPETSLFAAKKKKKKKASMAEKRKKRGKRLPPRPIQRPDVMDETDRVDAWDKVETTDEQVAKMKEQEDAERARAASKEQAKASNIVQAQMKSVKTLTHIKECVEALPFAEIAAALRENDNSGYFVKDDFLGAEVADEMEAEGPSMLQDNKLELDVSNFGSGEYTTQIGGGDQYIDCPRTVEYVVCLTRHLASKLEAEEGVSDDLGCSLNDAASMAGITVFSRRGREENPPERPFGYATGGDAEDARKVTVLYFLTPNNWNEQLGGGVAFKKEGDSGDGAVVEAKKDRLVIFRSDTSFNKMLGWIGEEGMENGSCVVIHLVKKSTES